MKYVVRDNFYLHGVSRQPVKPGETVELTEAQAKLHAHKIEAVAVARPTAKSGGDVK